VLNQGCKHFVLPTLTCLLPRVSTLLGFDLPYFMSRLSTTSSPFSPFYSTAALFFSSLVYSLLAGSAFFLFGPRTRGPRWPQSSTSRQVTFDSLRDFFGHTFTSLTHVTRLGFPPRQSLASLSRSIFMRKPSLSLSPSSRIQVPPVMTPFFQGPPFSSILIFFFQGPLSVVC